MNKKYLFKLSIIALLGFILFVFGMDGSIVLFGIILFSYLEYNRLKKGD